MLDTAPQAARIADYFGSLPLHDFCRAMTSAIPTLKSLLAAFPDSVLEKTKAGETPLDLTIKTATEKIPKQGLIQCLKRKAEDISGRAAKKPRG